MAKRFKETAKGFVSNASSQPGSSAFESNSMDIPDVTALAQSEDEDENAEDDDEKKEEKTDLEDLEEEEEEENADGDAEDKEDEYEKEVKEYLVVIISWGDERPKRCVTWEPFDNDCRV